MLRIAVVLAAVAACAEPKPDPNHPGDGSGSNMVCHEVTDTGTMFSHTECTPIEDKKAQQDDAQRFMKKPRSQPTGTHY